MPVATTPAASVWQQITSNAPQRDGEMKIKRTLSGMVLLFLACDSAHAAVSGTNGKIAFQSSRDGNGEIYLT